MWKDSGPVARSPLGAGCKKEGHWELPHLALPTQVLTLREENRSLYPMIDSLKSFCSLHWISLLNRSRNARSPNNNKLYFPIRSYLHYYRYFRYSKKRGGASLPEMTRELKKAGSQFCKYIDVKYMTSALAIRRRPFGVNSQII